MGDLGVFRHGLDQIVGDDLGIEIVQADPVEVQLAQLPQQPGQAGAVLPVHAIAGDVLGDDDELLHPGLGQLSGLGQHRVHRPAAIAAPQLGDDAEGAAVAAPLGDLQIGGVARGGDDPLPVLIGGVDPGEVLGLLPGHQLLHGGDHVGIAPRAQHSVHLGQFLADVVGIALGQAAGHQQLFQLALLFQMGQL